MVHSKYMEKQRFISSFCVVCMGIIAYLYVVFSNEKIFIQLDELERITHADLGLEHDTDTKTFQCSG